MAARVRRRTVLDQAEMHAVRSGRRWFTLPEHPGWKAGQFIRIRSEGDEGLRVKVVEVAARDGEYRVRFTLRDERPEERYLSAGWPDYTSDPRRAMREEKPPFPEDVEDEQARKLWLALALGHVRHEQHPPPRTVVQVVRHCKQCGAELKPPLRPVGAPKRVLPAYCDDKCTLLATYEGRRCA